jgi:TolA-binding protein
MKKQWIAFLITALLMVGGCSFVEEASTTVTYVNEAVNYVSEVDAFVKEVPPLTKQAVSDKQALIELEAKLTEMKEDIQSFNELQAPEVAADLHQQVVAHNQKAEEGIDLYLNHIEDGKLDPAVLENTEVFQTLQEITSIIEQIKQLGQ